MKRMLHATGRPRIRNKENSARRIRFHCTRKQRLTLRRLGKVRTRGDSAGQHCEVSDLLIRDVPDDVIARLDAAAERLGLSRVEYVRRQLAQTPTTVYRPITQADMQRFATNCAGLADEELMKKAWGC
jgi:hypothetical protein